MKNPTSKEKEEKMVDREELEAYLKIYLEVDAYEDFCPNGLQVEGKSSIGTCGFAVSADRVTLQKAVDMKLDALIVHHGLFWKNDPYAIRGILRERLGLVFMSEMNLFAYHLPLDAHHEVGNNFQAAKELGWHELKPFGIGVFGKLRPMPLDAFIAEVEAFYNHSATVALGGKKTIRSAALVSGGAYKDVVKAAQLGVDCFITGNFDEPAWSIAHEAKINFLALGHTATEKIGPKALGDHIATRFNIECPFINTNNPF